MNVGNARDLSVDFEPLPRSDYSKQKPEINTEHYIWSLDKSMFRDMIVSEARYDEMLKSDMANSRINKVIRSPSA